MKKMQRMLLVWLGCLVFLSACSGGTNNPGGQNTEPAAQPENTAPAGSNNGESADGELPHVELIWYYGVSQVSPDQQQIEDEVNRIVEEKLNATVKLRPIDFGSYTTKL